MTHMSLQYIYIYVGICTTPFKVGLEGSQLVIQSHFGGHVLAALSIWLQAVEHLSKARGWCRAELWCRLLSIKPETLGVNGRDRVSSVAGMFTLDFIRTRGGVFFFFLFFLGGVSTFGENLDHFWREPSRDLVSLVNSEPVSGLLERPAMSLP